MRSTEPQPPLSSPFGFRHAYSAFENDLHRQDRHLNNRNVVTKFSFATVDQVRPVQALRPLVTRMGIDPTTHCLEGISP